LQGALKTFSNFERTFPKPSQYQGNKHTPYHDNEYVAFNSYWCRWSYTKQRPATAMNTPIETVTIYR